VIDSPTAPLTHWLRLLWNQAPPLHLHGDAPFIADGAIHLPACHPWRGHCAAAAHAAAHLVYSPRRFDTDGLVPIARTLLALLEDARTEALAMRELPGLARLWRPLHTATPDDGTGFEALLGRLARALADPAYVDPHPWVRKGRRLFYLDEGLGLPALCTPAALRDAALRLGHDIGQLRLPFNAEGYRPVPAYRDDHRWMWPADQQAAVQPPPAAQTAGGPAPPDPPWPETPSAVTRHPEWDRLIQRLRPDWCSVQTHSAVHRALSTGPADPAGPGPSPDPHAHALGRRLLSPLRALARPVTRRGRSSDGEVFDLDALVDWQLAQRLRSAGDPRLYRAPQRQAGPGRVWLLVDQSASSATRLASRPHGAAAAHPLPGPTASADDGPTRLQAAARSATAVALALQALGLRCTVAAFRSQGRHAVRLDIVKRLTDPADGQLGQRLQALRPGGSTRLGAALRHATSRLGDGGSGVRWVLLLSDGEVHDIDVHDPHYLVDDARHAVRAAGRRGVRMACLALGAASRPPSTATRPLGEAQRIFGRRGTEALTDLSTLPRCLRRLMGSG